MLNSNMLNSANYIIAINGDYGLVYGTSASAPVVGAMLSMVNDARLSAGKAPVGFINPAIYSTKFKKAWTDIKIGGNQGCGTPGFTAVTGWDPGEFEYFSPSSEIENASDILRSSQSPDSALPTSPRCSRPL